ncbi:MAG TPA: PIN domain nuclease [Solirubrobacterales bacterium]|nr:PIN domain nuclease [Solirubrobacterales bacterium]
MILIDSSAWIEFLRETGSPAHREVHSALRNDQAAWTDAVAMELLAGARGDTEREDMRRLLYGRHFLGVEGPADFEDAAELFRTCRRGGEMPRQLTDCLIAVVAMRNEAELLCCDADFQVIARHAPLRLARASGARPV